MKIQAQNEGFITVLVLVLVMMMGIMCLLLMHTVFLTQSCTQDVLSSFRLCTQEGALKLSCARLCIRLEKQQRPPGMYTFICPEWPRLGNKNVEAMIKCLNERSSIYSVQSILTHKGQALFTFKGKIAVINSKRALIKEWRVI